MDFRDVVSTSGAARQFRPDPVPEAVLREVLDLARFAPSGGNRQPWHVILVRDPDIRADLLELCERGWHEYYAQAAAGLVPFAPGDDGAWHGAPVDLDSASDDAPAGMLDSLRTAPVVAVLVADLRKLAITDIDAAHVSIIGGGSVYPFAQNLLLAARNAGLAGVMTTFLLRAEAPARELFGIPASHTIAGVLALGYPVKHVTKLRRGAVDEFTTIDRLAGEAFAGGSGAFSAP